jgi:cell division septation protein DedD
MAEPGDRAVPDGKTRAGASDALDFEPVTRKKGSQNFNIKLFLTLVVLTVVVGGGAWYFYGQRLIGGNDAAPLIRADESPVKVRPDNPGGMVVPNRDKLVYDRMQGLENQPAERLLPPPEIPLAPPGAQTAEKTLTVPAAPPPPAPEPAARPTTAEVLAAKPPSPPPPALEAEVKNPLAAVKPEPPKAKPKAGKKAATPAAKATPPAKAETLMARTAQPPKAPAAVYLVQLAAVRTPERAREEWARLQKKHKILLGSLSLSLTRADLGTKGVFYRLRAGPLATQSAARELCRELARRKVGCLIIRPEK